MKNKAPIGVYQLKNGNWGYRYGIVVDGKTVWKKKARDQDGKVMKNKTSAVRARKIAIAEALENKPMVVKQEKKTIEEVFEEYCNTGRRGKAYTTIRKQDSLWKNHIGPRFGKKYVDEIVVAEINDYLNELYYLEGRAYRYVESFLKMFYLILGQAYTRGYLDVQKYNLLCKDKDVRIHMPKMKVEEDTDIQIYTNDEMDKLDVYFKDSNAETAYLLGRYCGLRINEVYGLKWENVNLDEGTILVDRQMQYQEGLIKLVPLKTRNAKRVVYLNDRLREHLNKMKEISESKENIDKELRTQNQTIIEDLNCNKISSLELVNCLANGKIQTINSMKFHSKKIKETLGIEFKFHNLRHYFGTSLANMNTPSHLLRNQMGHANISVTLQYYVAISEDGRKLLMNNINNIK